MSINVNGRAFIIFSSMDTVLAEPALLGTLKQANPKGNALKHCLMQHLRQGIMLEVEASKGQQQINLNPWREATNRM